MSWTSLTNLLKVLARNWGTLVIILRFVIIDQCIKAIYADEQSAFNCNTVKSGCVTLCYSAFAPISNLLFWQAQIYGVIVPSAIYLTYALTCALQKVALKQPKVEEKEEEALTKPSSGRRCIKLAAGLMTAYTVQLLARAAVDAVFLFGQYKLFGVVVPPIYECTVPRCKVTVDCFVTRSYEKTIFLICMYSVTAVFLFFYVLEFSCLVFSCVRNALKGTSGNGQPARAPRDIEEGNWVL